MEAKFRAKKGVFMGKWKREGSCLALGKEKCRLDGLSRGRGVRRKKERTFGLWKGDSGARRKKLRKIRVKRKESS